MTGFSGFSKIHALGTSYIADIFDDEVEVTEKVDGSQFAFGVLDGVLRFRSKGKEIYPDAPEKMFAAGVDYVSSITLPENIIFYGEYLRKPKHNTLAYERIPKNHIALFGAKDVFDENGWYDMEGLVGLAYEIDVDVVPLLARGKVQKPSDIFPLIERESFLGGPMMEGCVVKNYYKRMLMGGYPVSVVAGKYVSEKFKEVHGKTWNKENSGKGKWEALKDDYRTEARWEKAVQHLRDDGKLVGEPKDIGSLIKAVQQDITEEEQENIKAFLWREFGKELLRHSVRGLPEWYKQKLVTDLDDAA